ncbi:hypothetical protein CGCVW01_v011918 [Colletotrichum viniferum]|nr:hypothetical protein CGCVW01_v011918 [Colletotrichum viniferum]
MPCQTTCEITGERQRPEPGVVGWETTAPPQVQLS